MKKLLLCLLFISSCAFGQANYLSPYDPGAARDDLSNVSGAVELTLSQKVKSAWAEITGNIYASGTARIDGQITSGNGTAAAPAYTFSSDPNTGIYSAGADTIGFAEGGAEAMRINSSGEVLIATSTDAGDYKLQMSGNALINGLYAKSSSYVGYGTGGTVAFEIGNSRTADGSSYIDLIGDTTYSDFGLRIIRNSGANGGATISSRGTGALTLSTLEAADLNLATTGSGRIVIKSGGNVLIGTTTDDTVNKLQVLGSMRLIGGAAPGSPTEGSIYFNSTDKHFYGYNGTGWVQLDN